MFAEMPSYSKLSWVFCTKQAYRSWLNFIDFLPCFIYITIPCPLKPLRWTFQTSTESHLPFLWTKIAHDIFLFTHKYSLKFLFLSLKKKKKTIISSSIPWLWSKRPLNLQMSQNCQSWLPRSPDKSHLWKIRTYEMRREQRQFTFLVWQT